MSEVSLVKQTRRELYLGDHADDESLLLDLVRLNGVSILEDFAYLPCQCCARE